MFGWMTNVMRPRAALVVLSVAAAAVGLVPWQGARGNGRAAPLTSLPLAPGSSLRALSPPPDPGAFGPEGVPVPAAPALAHADAPAPSNSVYGISAAAAEQLAFHIHAHLTVFVAGAPRRIPYGVGIAPPLEVESTAHHVTTFFNGRHFLGKPREIPLLAHAQIQLDIGRPVVGPESIQFPPGL